MTSAMIQVLVGGLLEATSPMSALIRSVFGGILFAALIAVGGQAEEAPEEPRFAVASIHPVSSNAPVAYFGAGFTPIRPGGQYIHPRTTLMGMITLAYNIDFPAVTLEGLPKWARSQQYDVAAKPHAGFPLLSQAENLAQVRLMMRGLLKERFGLRVHSETRLGPVVSMEIAKGGIRMKKVSAPSGPNLEGRADLALDDVSGRLISRGCTMSELRRVLAIFLRRPVLDRTGLAGFYAFDVRWAEPGNSGMGALSSGVGTVGLEHLTSNVRRQLGLQLKGTNGSVEYWVVDQVKEPTPN